MSKVDLKLDSEKWLKPNYEKVTEEILSTIQNNTIEFTSILSIIHKYKLTNLEIPDELGICKFTASKHQEKNWGLNCRIKFPSIDIGELNLNIGESLYIREIDFSKCKIKQIAPFGLANLRADCVRFNSEDIKILHMGLANTQIKDCNIRIAEIEPFALYNTKIKDISLDGIKEFPAYSVFNSDISDIILTLDNTLYEDSIGRQRGGLYLPVSKMLYDGSMKRFLKICQKELHGADHRVMTKEELSDSIDFFLYYAQNEIDLNDETSPDEYHLYKDGGYKPIKYSKFKSIDRHGILLWLSTILCRDEMSVEEKEYKESLLNGLYKIFITRDQNTDRKVYLYAADTLHANSSPKELKYTQYLSGEDELKGKLSVYIDKDLEDIIANKKYDYYKPAEKSFKEGGTE